jgi:uncharacterized protein involved in cysteine biosynthesis
MAMNILRRTVSVPALLLLAIVGGAASRIEALADRWFDAVLEWAHGPEKRRAAND